MVFQRRLFPISHNLQLALDILGQHCLLTANKVLAYGLDFIDFNMDLIRSY